jgi:hypothetical protein
MEKVIDFEAQSAELAVEMGRAFRESRLKYNTLVGDISTKFSGDLYWGLGSLASRNKYYSPLVDRCTKIMLIQNRLESGTIPDTIRSNDRVLCRVLKNNFGDVFPSMKFECTESKFSQFLRVTRPPRQYLLSITILLLRFMASRSPDKIVEQIKHSQMPVVLLDTFVLNNNGDEGGIVDGVYKDRYYPGLLNMLTNTQSRAVWYIPTTVGFFNFFSIFKKIRTAKSKFILIDDIIKVHDYIFALLFPFKYLSCHISKVEFDGIDITHMVKNEQVNNSCDYMSIQSLLYYRFGKSLKERGVLVEGYIDWNENQAIDKAMIKGFRDSYKDMRIVGYQGYIVSKDLHLYCFPTEYEVLSGFLPDTMYVAGEGFVDGMSEFTQLMDVQVGPAFRFQKVWRTPKYQPSKSHFEILLGLPNSLTEATHIAQMVQDATDNFSPEYGHFKIKPHPTYSIKKVQSLLGLNDTENIEFVSGDFHDVVEKSNLLISSSSSVYLESLAKGVPVIIVGSVSGVTQNPIPSKVASEMWCVVYNSISLSQNIQIYKNPKINSPVMFQATGDKIRAEYFNPVTVGSVKSFVFGVSKGV